MYYILQSGLGNCSNLKLVVWATCYGATSDGNGSISAKAVSNGAKCSVAWDDVTYDGISTRFTDVMFTSLALGNTVSFSINYALAQFSLPVGNIEKIVVNGSSSTTITSAAVNPRSTSVIVSADGINLLNETIAQGNFEKMELTDTLVRYYKTFNDIMTTEFIEVTYDDTGNIVAIEWPDTDVTEEDLPDIKKDDVVRPHFYASFRNNVINTETEIIYLVKNDTIIPVEIITRTLYDQVLDIRYLDMEFINLLDGTNMEMEDVILS